MKLRNKRIKEASVDENKTLRLEIRDEYEIWFETIEWSKLWSKNGIWEFQTDFLIIDSKTNKKDLRIRNMNGQTFLFFSFRYVYMYVCL